MERSDTVKAILVLETPSSCMGCNFMHCEIEENKEYCEAREIRKQIYLEKEEKPDWCPLKPMPNKNTKQYSDGYKYGKGYQNGYNACIDEILGDKE